MPSIADIVTTSRPSQATYFDANGVLKTAAANVWRRDYDPVTKAPLGLLVEPQGPNLLPYNSGSQMLTGWTAQAVTTENLPDAKFGTIARITETNENAGHGILKGYSASGVSLRHAYFKKGNRRYIGMGVGTVTSDQVWNVFDFDAGAWTQGNDVRPTSLSDTGRGYFQPENVGDGWWRLTSWRGSNAVFIVAFFNEPKQDRPTYAGSDGFFYMALPSVEEALFPSSSILTGSAAATRAADNLSFPLPAGTHNLTYTFDDNSTLVVPGVSGTYTIPTNLPRAHIKSIVARAA